MYLNVLELLIIFILGLCFGSFANVLIYRIPENKSIIFPGSLCKNCGNPILWYDNIPILSFILLRGKCRYCKTAISIQYPIIELLTALLLILLWVKLNDIILFFGYAVFIFILIIISVIDYRYRIIPDILSIPLIFIGLIFSLINRFLGSNLILKFGNSFLGILCGIIIFYLIGIIGEKFFKKEVLGGGDIKLVGAIGSFLGLNAMLISIFIGSLIGTLFSIILIYGFKKSKWNDYIPYGPFLSLGSIIYLLFFF